MKPFALSVKVMLVFSVFPCVIAVTVTTAPELLAVTPTAPPFRAIAFARLVATTANSGAVAFAPIWKRNRIVPT